MFSYAMVTYGVLFHSHILPCKYGMEKLTLMHTGKNDKLGQSYYSFIQWQSHISCKCFPPMERKWRIIVWKQRGKVPLNKSLQRPSCQVIPAVSSMTIWLEHRAKEHQGTLTHPNIFRGHWGIIVFVGYCIFLCLYIVNHSMIHGWGVVDKFYK